MRPCNKIEAQEIDEVERSFGLKRGGFFREKIVPVHDFRVLYRCELFRSHFAP